MAIFHLSAKLIKRSLGQSAVAAAAYRSGTRLKDEREGRTHAYDRRAGIEHSEIMAPENAPAWMRDRGQLWNAVEAVEKRKDAQLARELVVALPHELTPAERLELLRGFVREQFVQRGMIVDLAIHAPDREGDNRNFHAHLLATTRTLADQGFGPKERNWNSNEALQGWREGWAEHCNRALERAGRDTRIDHRRLDVQRADALDRGEIERAEELDRQPTFHIGKTATALERQGHATERAAIFRTIANDNGHRRTAREALRQLRDRAVQALALTQERLAALWNRAEMAMLKIRERALIERAVPHLSSENFPPDRDDNSGSDRDARDKLLGRGLPKTDNVLAPDRDILMGRSKAKTMPKAVPKDRDRNR